MKRHKKGLAVWAAALWTLFIWSNSLQNSTISAGTSGGVTAFLNGLLGPLGEGEITEHFVRKAAHFTEYAILGILLCVLLYALWNSMARERLPLVLLIGITVPLLDETIQLFVPGRSGEVKDVLLDFSGVLFGMAVAYILQRALRRRRKADVAG